MLLLLEKRREFSSQVQLVYEKATRKPQFTRKNHTQPVRKSSFSRLTYVTVLVSARFSRCVPAVLVAASKAETTFTVST